MPRRAATLEGRGRTRQQQQMQLFFLPFILAFYLFFSSLSYFISLISFPIISSNTPASHDGANAKEERAGADSSGSPSPQCPGEMHMAPGEENNVLFMLFWLNDRVTNISGTAAFFL